ncbi:flagellar associated repeat protein [Aneurinibacillus soli]|uniref:Bacterial Ig-like domain group 2 protein n=1 Tax=Aneurinibacillus soli TaxID=1500254 RepID=A0A0U5B0Q0_9BACL|nr:SwmB domain-containing protein [Aneurinibacillus soli]PYE57062.1 flagellar associated repeat protein [Aneurinibacillus soli]BAU29569.1 Bacterial Ig-like domain group 2 protein [Aneurinibacillus soli]
MKNQKKKATARAMAAVALLTSLFTVTPIGTHQVQAATDTTPPHLESILSSGDTITLTYDEELTLPDDPESNPEPNPDSPPGPHPGFPLPLLPTYTVHTSSGDTTIDTSRPPEGNTITLTPDPPINNPATIQYSGYIRVSDLAGNLDTSLDTPKEIIDNSHDTTPPQLVRSIISTDDIKLFYNEPLNPDEIDPADYKITVNGEPQAVGYAEIRGGMVRLIPNRGAIAFGDKVDLTYEAAKTTSPLQDKSGNKAENIGISAQATDLTPPELDREGIFVWKNELRFGLTEPIRLHSPGDTLADAFTLRVGSRTINVTGCSISASNRLLTLVLDDSVEYGESGIYLNYIGGNRIEDLARNPLAPFSNLRVTNQSSARSLLSIAIKDSSPLILPVGGKYLLTVQAFYSKGDPRDKIASLASYTWDNPNCATADTGWVTATAEGTTTITASYQGKTASIPVTVISEADYKKGLRDRLDPTHTGITLGTIIKFLRANPLEDFNMDGAINNDDVTYLMQLVSPKKTT